MTRRSDWLALVLALALGACNTLAFTPAPAAGWLELMLITGFAWLLGRSASARGAMLLAGAFGFGNFVTGIWWVYVSMHDYGGMSLPLAGTAMVLLAMAMALYAALGGALWWSGSRGEAPAAWPGWRAGLMLASAWTLANWLRGTLFSGFPWLATGYPQADGPLRGYAAVWGVYGVGWCVAFTGALLAQALHRAQRREMAQAGTPLALAVAVIAGGIGLGQIAWTQPHGRPLSVRLLQGNVPQDMKFADAGITAAIALYQRMITAEPADLVITPETAMPVLIQQVPDDWAVAVRQFVDRSGTALVFGAVGATPGARGYGDFTNSLYGVTPSQNTVYRYDKYHLVPFGEYVPYGFRWFVNLIQIPLDDFTRGAAVQPPFTVRDQSLALDICYEIVFGEEIAHTLGHQAQPATILANASNLGWFGNTVALPQTLQMAQMRALETGRPMLSATNTGPTAAVDADGRIIARLPAFTVGTLATVVQGRSGLTPYIRLGNAPALWLSIVLLAWGMVRARRTRQKVAQDGQYR